MSRSLLLVLLSVLLLTACGSKPSWDKEEVEFVSDRIFAENVKAVWTLKDGPASEAGMEKLIRLELKKNDGERIDEFDINHEKQLHLMVISKDLSYFNHIHPEYKGNGVFEIYNTFPSGGEYRMIADFKPTGGDSMTKLKWIQIEGEAAKPLPIIPDKSLEHVVEGKQVKLSMNELAAGKEVTLTFAISDDKTHQPITDLEPYLGAIGHVVILSADGERYVHVHANDGQGAGPNAIFETQFPQSGIYKIWGQFQKDNQVFTVPFVVDVP